MRTPSVLRCSCLILFCLGSLAQPALALSPQEAAAVVPASELVDIPIQIKLIEAARASDGAKQHIETITRRFPRRVTGSPQLDLAQAWLIDTFENWGASAHREQWGQVEVGFERGPSSGKRLDKEEQELSFITPVWSPGTMGPVKGRALYEPKKMEDLLALGDQLKGAWLLRNMSAPRGERSERQELFEEAGIAGTLQAASRDGRLITGGSMRVKWDDLPTMVRITLLYEEFQALKKELEGGAEIDLEFDIDNQFLHGPIPQYNVIADIVGSEWPDEFVIVQGHVDGWDGAQGACDNGTGVATTLEAARLLLELGVQPRRTIRFVFYGGEEQGLLGSRGYVKQHVDELDKISVVLNHDYGTNYLAGIAGTESMMEDFEQVFAPMKRLDAERPFEIRKVKGLRGGASDHAPFIDAGVPAFAWTQSGSGYRRLHHTQYDTIEEVNHGDQQHSSLVVALGALRLANLDHMLDRTHMREPQPRRMGVYLGGDKGTSLEQVMPDGRAAAAGWKAGDRIVSIDGEAVKRRRDVVKQLQVGGPRKTVILERDGEELETVLDWTDDPGEKDRQSWREREEKGEAKEDK